MAAPRSTVHRVFKRNVRFGNVGYRLAGRSGRPRSISRRQDRYIIQSVRRRRILNATQFNAALRTGTGAVISLSTVQGRLHERGLHARRRAACPALLPAHRLARRGWAAVHAH